MHTDPAGLRDIEISSNARVYHFAGTEHGAAALVLRDTRGGPDPPAADHHAADHHTADTHTPAVTAIHRCGNCQADRNQPPETAVLRPGRP